MKKLLWLLGLACLVYGTPMFAQTINMGTSPINFGLGCGYGQIKDLNGTRKLSIGGYNACIGPPSGFTTVTVDYWLDRVGIGYAMTSPTYQLQLSRNSAAKPGSAYWTVVSDARFKKEIRPYTRGMDLIKAIDPVYFKYNEASGVVDESEFVGVLAQDLQAVAPDMVQNIPHPEDDKKTTDYLSVDLSQLDFALVNSVKELDAELERLRAEIIQLREELRQAQQGNVIQNRTGSLQISPNPFQSNVQVKYALEQQVEEATLNVYNMKGQLIHSEQLGALDQGQVDIDLDQLATGTLVIQLQADGQLIDSQQIIQAK